MIWEMNWPGVESTEEVRGGELVFQGTRVPVSQVLSELAEGKLSLGEITEDYGLDLKLGSQFLEFLGLKQLGDLVCFPVQTHE